MGYNTTVIILNDALGEIEKDTEFGKKLVAAILHSSLGRDAQQYKLDVSSGCNCNAATVIESHHADITTLVAVGGNCGSLVSTSYGFNHTTKENQIRIIKEAADKYGYRLVKKSKK